MEKTGTHVKTAVPLPITEKVISSEELKYGHREIPDGGPLRKHTMESTLKFPTRLALQKTARLIPAMAEDDTSALSHATHSRNLCITLHHIHEHSA